MRGWFAGLLTLGFLIPASPVSAWFERSQVGARALSLGENFVSVADDASAVYWNPAGVARLDRHQIAFATESSADLEGVRQAFVAGVLHTRFVSAGLGWSRLSLVDAAHEDLVYVSVSRTLVQRTLGAFISSPVEPEGRRPSSASARKLGACRRRTSASRGMRASSDIEAWSCSTSSS